MKIRLLVRKKNVNHLASTVALHWIFCNVYPQSLKTIREKIQSLKDEIDGLKKYPKKKRGSPYYSKLENFVAHCRSLFDVIGNKHQIKKQESLWNVKMTEEDFCFYKNQTQNPRVGYCTNFVCRKSEVKDMKRAREKKRQLHLKQNAEEYKKSMNTVPTPNCASHDLKKKNF